MAQSARMEWAALLPCGTVTARFEDGSCALLHPAASRFIVESPAGTRVTHLTRFVTNKHRAKVRPMLDFRNTYSDSAPVLCSEVLFDDDKRNVTTCPVPRTSAWWTEQGPEGERPQELDSGAVIVRSVDGAAQLVLAGHGKFFSVSYLAHAPSLDACRKGRTRKPDAAREHWKVERLYSCHSLLVPDCWKHPLWLAKASKRKPLLAQGEDQATDPVRGFLFGEDTAQAHGYVQTELPAMADVPSSAASSAACAEGMVDALASREGSCASLIEWNDTHLLRFVPGEGSVEMSSLADNSVHVLDPGGRFLTSFALHMRGHDATTLCIEGDAIPRLLLPPSLSVDVVHRALSIQAAHRRRATGMSAVPPPIKQDEMGLYLDQKLQLASKHSTQVLQRCNGRGGAYNAEVLTRTRTEGVGVFTAFRDGRARGQYEDRTIAELSSDQSTARVILASGEEVEVRAEAAFGVEGYVVVLRQFAEWAFRTEPERVAVRREQESLQSMVEQELFKIRRLQHAGKVPC